MRNYREISLWERVEIEQWSNWRWQIANAIRDAKTLGMVLSLEREEARAIEETSSTFGMMIPPHVACLIPPDQPDHPIRRAFVPSALELENVRTEGLFADVNEDMTYSPVKGLVHRYPSKVLLFPSGSCGSSCRYCFRRGTQTRQERTLSRAELTEAFAYIGKNPGIEEVILSGGDPLVLPDDELEWIMESISLIPHVKFLRLHSRIPVTIPYRLTEGFVGMLKRVKPRLAVFLIIHIDSVAEISTQMKTAITSVVQSGIPCFASCPLLKGINDSENALRTLWTELLRIGVKPYYLFHSDPVSGLKHFLVSLEEGIRILRCLYDRMSGLAMPLYCLNIPAGGGHVIIGVNSVKKIGTNEYAIVNFEGKEYVFRDLAD